MKRPPSHRRRTPTSAPVKCSSCGEPWSSQSDAHQPGCSARMLLSTKQTTDRRRAVELFAMEVTDGTAHA